MLTRAAAFIRHLPRDNRDTLFLLFVIAWVLMPQAGRLALWCSALAASVLLWRGWLAVTNRPLPSRWWLLTLLALTMAATFFTHRTLLGRDPGVTMLVVLLSLKTLELRARRDAFVVFFLGFFCMLSNFFYSQSLLTALGMMLGLLGLLTVLVNAHMPVGKPPLLAAAKTAGWMAALGAPIMVVLFLLFPRVAPLWGLPSDAVVGRSGLSQSMRVGTIASLALDDSIALRIKFEGRAPPQSDLYFRGPVLASFDGTEWRPQSFSFPSRYSLPANLVVTGAPIAYEVTLEPTNRPWLFVMEAATQKPTLAGYQSAMQADLQWMVNRPIADQVRYQVQSYPGFTHGPQQAVLGLREFVELPPGFNARTLELASQIRRDPRYATAGSAELVKVVMERLRGGGYTYTLEPGVYGKNTADEFWFDRKAGFCEHIASSFVILMRALDVPARIVTGYQGGEQNPVDGFWTLRQSDAHAWAEVWHEGRGWVRVDPTSAVSPGRTGSFQRLSAPRGVVEQAIGNFSPSMVLQFRATWEAINNAWAQRVLNYTQGKQFNLLEGLGFKSPDWVDLSYVLLGILVTVSLAGAAWTLLEKTRHDPWLRLLEKVRKQLSKAGLESTPASSPRQLAALVKAHYRADFGAGVKGKAAVLHDWLIQLEKQRYANTASSQSPLASRQALRQLKQQLKKLSWPA